MGSMIVKYIAAGLVLASLFVLVILGMMPVNQYVVLAVGTLSALGGYHAGSAKVNSGVTTVLNPTQPTKEG